MAEVETWGWTSGECVHCAQQSKQIVNGSSTRLNGLCWPCASEVLRYKPQAREATHG